MIDIAEYVHTNSASYYLYCTHMHIYKHNDLPRYCAFREQALSHSPISLHWVVIDHALINLLPFRTV